MSKLISLALSLSFLLWIAPVMASEMDDYQRSFDMYRQAYSIFEVNQADFVKSQTFAAEETLTNSARDMLLLRADSWSNYWKTMAVSYTAVTSSEIESQNQWKSFWETENSWLTKHKEELVKQKTRRGLLGEANSLNNRNEVYLSKAFQINVETTAGRMKDALIQVRELNKVLLEKAKNQQIEIQKQDLTIRGFESNLERLDQLEADLAIIRQDLIDESGFVDEEQFANISQDFVPLYQKLSQITLVTRELAEVVQW